MAEESRELAEHQQQFVTHDRLASTIQDYVECRAFAYWMRLVVEIEGGVTESTRMVVEKRCPGFLSYADAYRREHPEEREFLWMRLLSWFDANVFAFATEEGWEDALGYHAARDPKMDQIRAWWRECDDRWKIAKPDVFPSFEEWCLAAPAHGRGAIPSECPSS